MQPYISSQTYANSLTKRISIYIQNLEKIHIIRENKKKNHLPLNFDKGKQNRS